MTDDVDPPISGVSPPDDPATNPDSAIISEPPGRLSVIELEPE